uniref:Membrane-spanning 4-domains subfamily A member 15-like n=1 Tax=Geotrypetes seraphini TaxID=260995 RepID=A0A6P8PLX8_GEOSA|nr:membrane-spanning 4-domains subfamily A member 15-like [Geotrypetes seraphini]XP_033776591.1 membrane-spanning 4-domains subfamily A member 15-like [Geotrypetes seraphini]
MANVSETGNIQVVTEVLSQSDPRAVQLSRPTRPSQEKYQTPETIKTFNKGQPVALGSIQILLGLVHLFFGITFAIANTLPILTISSGVCFWTGIPLLISGSLSVAAEKREKLVLVKASLGSNLLSLVAGLVAVILFAVTMTEIGQMCISRADAEENNDTYRNWYKWCDSSPFALTYGLNGLFLAFLLLEIATEASIAAFAWKALRQAKYTQIL